MASSKRKNEGNNNNGVTTRVVVGNANNNLSFDRVNGSSEWIATTIDRIQQLLSTWPVDQPDFGGGSTPRRYNHHDDENDHIALAIQSIREGDATPEKKLVEQAHQVKLQLSYEIQQAKELCDQESSVLVHLTSQLAQFQEQRKALLEQIDELDESQRSSQKKIAFYQEEVSHELDVVCDLEEEKKRQVPRLKASISLYAVTTGIKWDFEDPDILSGQVVSDRKWDKCLAHPTKLWWTQALPY
jgi:hypothetical protein